MIEVEVRYGNLEEALRNLRRRVAGSGVFREMRIRNENAKPSMRRRRKAFLAWSRRRKAEVRRQD